MKRQVRERTGEAGYTIWYTVLAVVAVAILAIGALYIGRVVYPKWLAVQRMSVEQSKSFTDANNNMLETFKLEYARLDTRIAEAKNDDIAATYKSQQRAIIGKMCTEIATMQIDTVNPATLGWLNSKGGCK